MKNLTLKIFLFIYVLLIQSVAFCQPKVALNNAYLLTPLNGNGQSITNLSQFSADSLILIQLTATNFIIVNPAALTNGYYSIRENSTAPATITVTASVFNWTNTITTNNITVYINCAAATTIAKNGGTIFTDLVGATSIPLQPNQYISLTYSSTAPTAKWDYQ